MAKPKQEGRIKHRRAWLLSALATRANDAHHQARRFARVSALMAKEAGDALLRARNLVDKGGWGRWLTANFNGSRRTAQVYMRLCRK